MKILITAVLLFVKIYVSAQQIYSSFFEGFSNTTSQFFYHGTGGFGAGFTWNFGVESPTEPGTKILSLKIDPNDKASPWQGPNISSRNNTHFGTYAMRIKVPDATDVQPNVGAVVGFFTYTMDNTHGISEIDFEWLIADPEIIYIGAWTGMDGDLRRIGRTINLAKGIIYNSNYRELRTGTTTSLTGTQNQPATISAIEGYDASSQFHTYGFDWYKDRLRWWMLHPATADTVVLWDFQGAQAQSRIPQHPSRYLINFWHTNDWPVHTNSRSIERPVFPFEAEIDWASYVALPATPTNTNARFTGSNKLYQNYPNPFSLKTTIPFSLKEGSHVTLIVYNLLGQKVEVLINEYRTAGEHTVNFDPSGLTPGVYLYQLQSGDFYNSSRMIFTD